MRHPLTALLTLALVAAIALPAGAQDAAKPAPCADQFIEDGTGDAEIDVTGGFGSAREGTPNTDITKVWLGVGGTTITANIEVVKLDKTVPNDSTGGLYYYVFFAAKGEEHYVVARVRDNAVAYKYGTFDSNTGVYTNRGDTKGQFIEGDKGVVSIEVPADEGLAAGTEVGQVRAAVDTILGEDDEVGLNGHVDEAPNEGGTVSLTPTACDAPAPGTSPTPSIQQPAAPATLPFRAANVLGKASKAKKGRTVTVKVSASQTITNLKVSLKRSNGKGATLATASLKRLTGNGKLRLKFKRTVKKGRYALIATGTAGGKRLRSAQQVALR